MNKHFLRGEQYDSPLNCLESNVHWCHILIQYVQINLYGPNSFTKVFHLYLDIFTFRMIFIQLYLKYKKTRVIQI